MPPDDQANADAENADDTANQQGDENQDDDDESLDGLKSALEKERDERKKAQKALRDFKRTGSSAGRQQSGSAAGSGQGNQQGNQQQGDSPEMSRLRTELETYKATAEKAQRANLIREVRDQARTHAKALGAVDPDAVARMVQLDDIDVTDDGNPEGVDDAIRDLKKAHPALFGKRSAGSGDGGAGSGGSNGGGTSKDVGIGVSRLRHAYAESSRSTR